MSRTLAVALLAGPLCALVACAPAVEPALTVAPAPAAAVSGLKVQYHTYSTGSASNQLAPLLSIVNAGSSTVALSDLTVRYWYTRDGTQSQNYYCDYTPRGCGNVRARFVALAAPVSGADGYLELAFTSGAGTLSPGASTGDIQSRVAKSDWSSYDQRGDYSFDATRSSTPADWGHVTLYQGGALIWGVEPGGSQPTIDTQAPTAPTSLVSTGVTSTSVSLAWAASTDDVGVVGYDVYAGSARLASATTTSASVTGLAAGTTYTLTVQARDAAGNLSPPSNAVTVTTPPPTGPFQLVWQDDFDGFDGSRWQLMTHSWDGNLAQFSTANTRFQNGILSLLLTREPSDGAKPFRGVEMRSRSTITYGKIETRARFARGSGVVSGTVLIYTPWPADDWNELDVEFLGAFTDRVQFNAMVYTGAPVTPPVTVSVTPTQFPQTVALGFDATADFHVYGVEWTPAGVTYTVDGVTRATWSSEIARMRLPQNILLTIWASSSAGWAGPIVSSTAPTQADFDWIRVYRYAP